MLNEPYQLGFMDFIDGLLNHLPRLGLDCILSLSHGVTWYARKDRRRTNADADGFANYVRP